MDKKLNWFQHIEQFDRYPKKHLSTNSEQTKFNYKNVDSNSKCHHKTDSTKCNHCHSAYRQDLSQQIECRVPANFVNRFIIETDSGNKQKLKSYKMNSSSLQNASHSPLIRRTEHLWIGLILFCSTTVELINCGSINEPPTMNSANHHSLNSIQQATRASWIHNSLNQSSHHSSKESFFKLFRSFKLPRLKRSFNIRQFPSYDLTNQNMSTSEGIIDSPVNQLISNSNVADSLISVGNSTNLELTNDIGLSNKSTRIDQTIAGKGVDKIKLDAEKRDEQERVLNEIDQINEGHVCSSLNKKTHFKGSNDVTKENRDKKYWLLVKALEPKFVRMPLLANQMQPSQEIKNHYRNLIEKLELITSILYDNAEQINAVQHLQLMRKVIREIAFLHPHILRARLISLNSNANNDRAYRRRRESAFSIDFDDHLTDEDYNPNDANKLLTNVPFRRRTIRQDINDGSNFDNINDQMSDADTVGSLDSEQWLRAKNILFYMRNEQEPLHEFQDVTLTTKREHVSWLDIREVEEKSGTLKEFDQLLTLGHLFVMNEKERLFSGYTGIYFDCANRRWLLSYTSLLVSCNQCSSKKSTASTGDSELEMRLVGLLSVDIDLETVDINQCETPESDRTESSANNLNKSNKRHNLNANQLKQNAQKYYHQSIDSNFKIQ